jgi:hypothetical protein
MTQGVLHAVVLRGSPNGAGLVLGRYSASRVIVRRDDGTKSPRVRRAKLVPLLVGHGGITPSGKPYS